MKTPFLSTSFSQNGEKAKSRFDNILDTKTKKFGVLGLVLIVILAVIFAVIFSTKSSPFANQTLYSYLGQSLEDVQKNIDLGTPISQDEQYKQYLMDGEVDGEACEVKFIFINDYLFRYEYTFENDEMNNTYPEKMKEYFLKKLGDKDYHNNTSNAGTDMYWDIENKELTQKFMNNDDGGLFFYLTYNH